MTIVIKAKHIDEKGQFHRNEVLLGSSIISNSEVDDLACVETSKGPQIVLVTDVSEWNDAKPERVQTKLAAKVYKSSGHHLRTVIGVQPGAGK